MRASLSLEGMGCELPPGAAAYTQPGDPPPFNIVIRYVPLPKRSAPRAKPGGVNFRPSNRVLRIVLPKDRVVRATLAVTRSNGSPKGARAHCLGRQRQSADDGMFGADATV